MFVLILDPFYFVWLLTHSCSLLISNNLWNFSQLLPCSSLRNSSSGSICDQAKTSPWLLQFILRTLCYCWCLWWTPTGTWRRSGRKSTIIFFAASEGHLVCLHRGMPVFLSYFCFKQGDLSSVTVTGYNYRNKRQNTEAWMKNISWEQIQHYQRPYSDLQPKTTAHKGLFQSKLSVTEDLVWSQSHWLDLCCCSPNTKVLLQRMAWFSYYWSPEIVG